MLSYAKLWILLEKMGLQRTDLTKKKIISTATLAKLGKNENVNSSVIEKICRFLKCQPGDIMEYISEEDVIKTAEILNQQFNSMMQVIQTATGMSIEALYSEFLKEAPAFFEEIKKNPNEFKIIDTEIFKSNNTQNEQTHDIE